MIRRFEQHELRDAIAYAKAGEQALHVHRMNLNGHPLFRRYPLIAHLFDQNIGRLTCTARALGVRVVKIEHRGTDRQHIDLCGKPFEKACLCCEQMDLAT
jgi:hypothetical protein